MDIWERFKSPLGYFIGDNNIDSDGVDHSGFTTKEELEYQLSRQKRENKIIYNDSSQGINKGYLQDVANFGGNSPENSNGFDSPNISNNIEKMRDYSVLNNNILTESADKNSLNTAVLSNSFGNTINPYTRINQLPNINPQGYFSNNSVSNQTMFYDNTPISQLQPQLTLSQWPKNINTKPKEESI